MGDVGSARYKPALFPPCPTYFPHRCVTNKWGWSRVHNPNQKYVVTRLRRYSSTINKQTLLLIKCYIINAFRAIQWNTHIYRLNSYMRQFWSKYNVFISSSLLMILSLVQTNKKKIWKGWHYSRQIRWLHKYEQYGNSVQHSVISSEGKFSTWTSF